LECGQALSAAKPETAIKHATVTTAPTPSHPDSSAERRQLTVAFVDLVGSTALSAGLDPEDMRDIIGVYHRCCAEIITKSAGFVAKYMGDGVLAYFGYPQAHEDDAERSVRSALELIEAVPKLRTYHDIALQVRVGIATGIVVVGDLVGEGAAQEQGVVGDTPNLAARLQALAEPGQAVISQSTRRLTGGLFEYGNLGRVTLKGLPDPVQAWQVLRESAVQSRFEAQHEAGLMPLVGREEELDLLLHHWRQAASGEGRVVLLSGEPGIGKSRLIAELQQRLQSEPHTRLQYFCSPHHQDSPLHPTIAQIERAAGFQRGDTPEGKLNKLVSLLALPSGRENDIQLLAELLSVPTGDRYAPVNLSPQQKKEKTFLVLLAQLETLARQHPVVMVYEDVHWIDPSSRSLLDRVVGRVLRLPVLLIITFRPEFQPHWTAQAHVTSLVLTRLGRPEGMKLVGSIAGNALSDEVVADIVERTDGVPLFVEEVTKAVVEAGSHDESARDALLTTPLPPLGVPATLHASLIARLDRLGPVAKEIAQIGAVIGREFDYELLDAVAKRPEVELKAALDPLTEAELVFQRGTIPRATFLFKHALVRDTAYGSLLRNQRRELHARISEALESNFPEVGERQPEVLARHLTEAGLTEHAIEQWLKAGQHAAGRSAHLEAIAHLHRGLELLRSSPNWVRRVQVESDLQLALGVSFFSTKGLSCSEAASAYERARELCENSGDSARLFTALWGLWHSHNSSNRLDNARSLCLRLLSLTEKHNDAGLRLQAHHTAWTTFFLRGDPLLSLRHGDEGRRLYGPQMHHSHVLLYGGHDPNLCGLSISACDHWMLGRSDTALKCADDALRLAEELAHPLSSNMALQWLALLHQLRREPETAVARVAAAEALAAEQGLSLWINTRVLRGIALVKGQADAAVAQVREGLAIGQPSKLWRPYYLSLLAETLSAVGDIDGALAAVSEALSTAEASGERWWEAELCRQKGELRRSSEEDEESARWLQRALVVSRQQNAKSLELRAAMSLARLWRDQGKRSKALDLLAPVYGWFTEGHDTLDLKEAKALLEELA